MQNPEIVIIGAAIIDVLAYPVNVKVFETGSYSTEDIHMTTGADALNEATILANALFTTGVVFAANQGTFEVTVDDDDSHTFGHGNCFGPQ